jgi:hypothetical protein
MSKVDWSKAPEGAEFYALGCFRRQGTGDSYAWIFDNLWRPGGFHYGECLIADDYEPRPVSAPQWPDDEERIDRIGRDRTSDDTGHYAPTHPVTAVEFLNACVAVQSERGQQYDPNGKGERSFAAAAIAFTALTGKPLVGSDICLIIELVKKVRQYSKPDRIHHDSLLDSVSYDSLWAAELIKELSK